MPLFNKKPDPTGPSMASAEYAMLADRMLSLRGDISTVLRELETQSERLQHLETASERQPVALLLEVEKQVDHLAGVFTRAAMKHGRDEILAEVGKHAWKAMLGGITGYLLLQWTHVLAWFGK